MGGRRAIRRRVLAACTAMAFCTLGTHALGQTAAPGTIHIESLIVQAPMRVQTKLVLVPVYVAYQKRIDHTDPAYWPCEESDYQAFQRLSAIQAYVPKNCDLGEVRGLTIHDFRLSQDGVEQRIQSVANSLWPVVVRDNLTWHVSTSITPSGIWSSTDLGAFQTGWRNDFYEVAYVPSESGPGCHEIKVSADRPGTVVFARNRYCTGQTPSDPLYGTHYGQQLERDLASRRRGKIRLSLQAGSFQASDTEGRVDVRLGFPWNKLYHEWNSNDWKLKARIGVLGVVYREDGAAVSRFSDLLYPSYWPTIIVNRLAVAPPALVATFPGIAERVDNALQAKDPGWIPAHYETQFNLPPGKYTLKSSSATPKNLAGRRRRW